MKNEILMFYRQLRQSKFTVKQARRLTAEKFGISILLVVSIVTGLNTDIIGYSIECMCSGSEIIGWIFSYPFYFLLLIIRIFV